MNGGCGAQVLHCIPSLGEGLITLVENTVECSLRFLRTLRQHVLRRLQVEQQSLKTLQQGVVQFAGNTGALAQAFLNPHIKLPGDLVKPQAIQEPCEASQCNYGRQLKPPCLPESRLNPEGYIRLGAVPQTVAVGGYHPESVGAGSEVGVDDPAGRDRLTPALVKAIQTIAETDAIGHGKT